MRCWPARARETNDFASDGINIGFWCVCVCEPFENWENFSTFGDKCPAIYERTKAAVKKTFRHTRIEVDSCRFFCGFEISSDQRPGARRRCNRISLLGVAICVLIFNSFRSSGAT